MRKMILSLLPLFLLSGCGKEAASIGIIGGADGPTTIMVSGSLWSPVLAGLIIGLIWKKRHK